MHRWKACIGSAFDHVEAREDGGDGFLEVEHPAVSEPPDRSSATAAGVVLDEGREVRREFGRELVSSLLGQSRIAGEVDEADGGRLRNLLEEAGKLESDLSVVDRMLDPDVLSVPMVDITIVRSS